jgi:hypothetical protein
MDASFAKASWPLRMLYGFCSTIVLACENYPVLVGRVTLQRLTEERDWYRRLLIDDVKEGIRARAASIEVREVEG